MITSLANPQIKNLIQLQKKSKDRKEQGVFVCEGIKMFEEAKEASDSRLVKAYLSESFYNDKLSENDSYFKHISYEVVSDQVFKEAAETMTPQGVLAIVKQPEYHMEDLLRNKDNSKLLLLEDIRDPGNLGTIIRTAEGAGFNGVILSKGCVDIYNPKVIRSTMGAIYRVPFLYIENYMDIINEIKQENYRVFAAHLAGAVYYDSVDYSGNIAIMIGNEANGLSDESAILATSRIKIPMEGMVESLNAGVAASILMYEVYRQSRNKNK